MPLKSMKKSMEEKRDEASPSVVERDQFPFGLVIQFDEDSFAKLDLPETPEIGMKFTVLARAEVKSLDQTKGVDDVPKMTMSLQITDIGLDPLKEKEIKSAADSLYGGGDVS